MNLCNLLRIRIEFQEIQNRIENSFSEHARNKFLERKRTREGIQE